MTDLKVLVLHWGANGGGPRFSQRMASGLAQVPGVEVHIAYSAYADNASDWESLALPSHVVDTYRSMRELVLGVPRWFAAVRSLRRYILDNDIDVVFSGMLSLWQSLAMPFTVPRGVKYVSSIHDAVEHKGEQRRIVALARKRDISRADLVAAYSEHSAVELRRQVRGRRVTSLPLGADTVDAPVRDVPSEPLKLGFFGRIVEYKGVDLFAETVLELDRRGRAVRGIVAGNGEADPELVRRTEHLIDWQVRWIDEREIPEIFAGFDILMLPYKEASQSGVVTNAATFGVPVAATPVGALPQQVEEFGIGEVSERVEAASLADAVERLVDEPGRYEAASRSALEKVESTYSWRAFGETLTAELRTLFGRGAEGARS
ncbi:glycosyltransferase family 4 protein [Microbacterium lacusdiani]